MKALRWLLLGLAGLIVLVIAVVAVVVATFDPNAYKPRLVELVKQRTGRTLAIDGKIALTFFPKVGAAIGKATLSEPNGPALFARVDEAHVAVAVLPLLHKQVIVDRVTLTGLAVDLVRHKSGTTNFDDLTGKTAAPSKRGAPGEAPAAGSPLAVDVGGIAIENASIGWRDESDGTSVRLANVNLRTGRLASRVPGKLDLAMRVEGAQPKANLQIDVDSGYRIDLENQAVALSSLDAKVSGDAQGFTGIDARLKSEAIDVDAKAQRVALSRVDLAAKSKDGLDAKISIPRLVLTPDQAESQAITGEVALATPARSVSAKLQVAPLSAKGRQIQLSRMDVDFSATQADLSVRGKLASPAAVDLDRRQVQLPGIAGDLTLSGRGIPGGASKAAVKGAARADWGAQSAEVNLAVKLDDSNIGAKVAVQHWSAPAITFDIAADRLDVDRYLPPPAAGGTKAGAPAPAGGARPAGGAPAETPIDLSPLKALNAAGTVKIGALQVSRVKAQQVALTIKAAGGRLDISPITASLYQGTLAGSVAANAGDRTFAVKQKLSDISVGPLLRDAANRDVLEGRGAVVLDVTSAGTTVTALKKALAGTMNLALKDGAIKGVDLAAMLRTAQAVLGS
ncbi:MAG TPA: AsmA family protein, partial [Candidatus Methylomirabilis sp.]|nr:AsmA family protein [Candidatus Methylomirabilis sp.]